MRVRLAGVARPPDSRRALGLYVSRSCVSRRRGARELQPDRPARGRAHADRRPALLDRSRASRATRTSTRSSRRSSCWSTRVTRSVRRRTATSARAAAARTSGSTSSEFGATSPVPLYATGLQDLCEQIVGELGARGMMGVYVSPVAGRHRRRDRRRRARRGQHRPAPGRAHRPRPGGAHVPRARLAAARRSVARADARPRGDRRSARRCSPSAPATRSTRTSSTTTSPD